MANVQPSHFSASQNRDVWSDAQALIDAHGRDAPIQAARKALALVASGDHVGYLNWLRILQAVDTLLETEKPTRIV